MDGFQTAGAILAILLLVFQLVDRIPAARRFATNLKRRIKEVGQVFKDWRLWRTYHPTYEVIADHAVVTRDYRRQDYRHIELPIKIKYTSRDDRFDSKIKCECILIDMYHCGKRDKTPYRLYASSEYHDVILPPNDSVVREFVARRNLEAPAELNSTTECRVISVGSVRIHGVSKARELKSKKFNVEIRIQ